jgi:hypothetical protein
MLAMLKMLAKMDALLLGMVRCQAAAQMNLALPVDPHLYWAAASDQVVDLRRCPERRLWSAAVRPADVQR